jgi:hypothetical protein
VVEFFFCVISFPLENSSTFHNFFAYLASQLVMSATFLSFRFSGTAERSKSLLSDSTRRFI